LVTAVNYLRAGLSIALTVVLGACAATSTPPPVVEGSSDAPVVRESAPVEEATQIGETAALRPTAATASLLAAAAEATASARHGDAITYLERAVRIEPRNAELWIQLSGAHLADGNLSAANQHVRKAIALAGNDAALSRSAWLQLAEIREAEGNQSEARAIRERFSRMRG